MLTGAPAGARGYGRDEDNRQVFGGGASAAFIFSSMHLLTTSARLSRSSWALPFSVFIQHSRAARVRVDRKSTRLNSSHANISYAVFCLKKKNTTRALAY